MSVTHVAYSPSHDFTKKNVPSINLITGLGVEGDCHLGKNVQHRSRLHIKPPPANLRQVHVNSTEILSARNVEPGAIGENVTTKGIDVLSLGQGTKIHFLPASQQGLKSKNHPIIVVQGFRNPCPQIDKYRSGLKEQFIVRDKDRNIIGRTAGVMATVENGGKIEPGMRIMVEAPTIHKELECV